MSPDPQRGILRRQGYSTFEARSFDRFDWGLPARRLRLHLSIASNEQPRTSDDLSCTRGYTEIKCTYCVALVLWALGWKGKILLGGCSSPSAVNANVEHYRQTSALPQPRLRAGMYEHQFCESMEKGRCSGRIFSRAFATCATPRYVA